MHCIMNDPNNILIFSICMVYSIYINNNYNKNTVFLSYIELIGILDITFIIYYTHII